MDKIAEFVTPQMLEFLKRERADLGDGFQSTYIDNLVQLDGVDDRADKTIATLTFSGVSKTSRFDQGEVFSESWNMERAQGETSLGWWPVSARTADPRVTQRKKPRLCPGFSISRLHL
jgi:predicted lipid-binding transport protein (Tim44 family)